MTILEFLQHDWLKLLILLVFAGAIPFSSWHMVHCNTKPNQRTYYRISIKEAWIITLVFCGMWFFSIYVLYQVALENKHIAKLCNNRGMGIAFIHGGTVKFPTSTPICVDKDKQLFLP